MAEYIIEIHGTYMKRDRIKIDKRSKLMNLIEESYIGEIVKVDTAEFDGRCKIMVYGVYGDKTGTIGSIPVDDLPDAYPLNASQFSSSTGSGVYSYPKVGTKVRVIFDGDHYHPKYIAIEELDEQLKSVLRNEYNQFHSILWDSDAGLKIYHSEKSGLIIEYKSSVINIKPDSSMIIRHKDSSSVAEFRGGDIDIVSTNSINLSSQNNATINSNVVHVNGVRTDVGANPIYSSCNTEILMELILILATGLDAKYPNTPGQFVTIVNQFRSLILSNTVRVSP